MMLKRFYFGRATALCAVGLALVGAPVRAQVLDATFQSPDVRAQDLLMKQELVNSVVPDAQGRLLISGAFDFAGGTTCGNVARLLPDGRFDPTFNAGGSGANGLVKKVLALPNGQWLICGRFTRYNGVAVGRLARLQADGTLDATFNPGGTGANYSINDVEIDAQGRYLVAGNFSSFNQRRSRSLVRLLPTGLSDTSFAPDSAALPGSIQKIAVDATDRVLVAAPRYTAAPLVRLLPSGARDATFNGGTLATTLLTCLEVLPNGKLVVSGFSLTYNGAVTPRLVQLLPDGGLDAGFTSALNSSTIRGLVALPNGQLLVSGRIRPVGAIASEILARLNSDGTLDTSFSSPLPSPSTFFWSYAAVPQPNGTLVVVGSFTRIGGQAATGVARLTATGALDTTFANPALDQHTPVTALARQSGGRLLVLCGEGGRFQGISTDPIVRLLATGAPDLTFRPDPALVALLTYYTRLNIDATDRILVNGDAHVGRFLPTGAPDPSFSDGLGADSSVVFTHEGYIRSAVLQPDGRLLVWGDFRRYNGAPVRGLVRLTTSGAVDATFTPPVVGGGYRADDVRLLPDGTMLVRYLNDTTATILQYWLTAGGRPLASFNGGQPLTSPNVFVVGLPDNTILLDGSYQLGGTAFSGVRKVNNRSAIDPSFVLDPALANVYYVFHPQPDGLLLIHIYYDTPHGLSDRLARLTPTGTLDPTFTPVEFGTGYWPESMETLLRADNGDLLVGGGFTTVNGALHPNLVRLTNIPTGLRADAVQMQGIDLFPNPARTTLTLRRATAAPATAALVDVLGRTLRQWPLTAAEQTVPLADVPAGTYVVRVVGSEGVSTRRVVVQP